jgi:hypothetical protein
LREAECELPLAHTGTVLLLHVCTRYRMTHHVDAVGQQPRTDGSDRNTVVCFRGCVTVPRCSNIPVTFHFIVACRIRLGRGARRPPRRNKDDDGEDEEGAAHGSRCSGGRCASEAAATAQADYLVPIRADVFPRSRYCHNACLLQPLACLLITSRRWVPPASDRTRAWRRIKVNSVSKRSFVEGQGVARLADTRTMLMRVQNSP